MAIYNGKRPNGTTFQLEWEPVNEFEGIAKSHSPGTKLCRFCLEKQPPDGIGILIENVCSNKCEESNDWFNKNIHRFKQITQETSPEKKEMKEAYVGDSRALKYFRDESSRAYVIFSELLKAGPNGCLMTDLQKTLSDLTGATEKSIQQDVSAKSSKWRSIKTNPFHNEWWLFTSAEPKRGRPQKGSEGMRLWIVFKGGSIPDKAWVTKDTSVPQWVKEALK